MGVITEISSQKNKTRVNLFIDNSFFCGLMTETLVKFNLKVGLQVDEATLKSIIIESETRRGLNYAFLLVAKNQYTKKQIETKLKSKGYDKIVVSNILDKLEEYGGVNDESFALNYVNGSKYSKRMIEQKLKQKGVEDDIIKNALNCLKSDSEQDKIATISAKYMKIKPLTRENLDKLFRYLVGKGFDYELIKCEISKIRSEDYESWDWFS